MSRGREEVPETDAAGALRAANRLLRHLRVRLRFKKVEDGKLEVVLDEAATDVWLGREDTWRGHTRTSPG